MERLFTVIHAPAPDPAAPFRVRKACRAIIWDDDRLLLVKSRKFGDVKFPGVTREYGRSDGSRGTFCNESRYYVCGVYPTPGVQQLSDYEIEHGYEPVWMTPAAAADQNDRVPDDSAIPWKKRETAVLRLLAARRKNP